MTQPQASTAKAQSHLPIMLVICGCLIAMLTFGPRSTMGFFQDPMITMRGWDRTTFGLAMAIQNIIWGIGQPFFGALSDRFGTFLVLMLSSVFYASGLFLMSISETATTLYISGGILIGLGIAAGSFSIIMAAFARNVPAEKRTIVFGIGTAAGSAGMAFFAPLSVAMIGNLGWQDTMVWMSLMMLAIPILAIPFFNDSKAGKASVREMEQTFGEALKEALGHHSYVLLIAGFFVCGFQVSFITVHFPPYLNEIGIEPKYAGIALMLIGLFNIVGSIASGFIGQRYSKPIFLALIYIGRSIAVTVFLLMPQTPTSVVIFASVMGLLWLSTVAPTNSLVAGMFGTRYLGMLGGVVFFSHQVGSFLGVWLGGYLFDLFGSYDPVWWLGVGLGLFAAIVHWPIREAAVVRGASA
jgi:MFS family permease